MITLDELRTIARCGACHMPLVDKDIKLVMLPQTGVLWLPAWKSSSHLGAIGVLCQGCIDLKLEPDEAIEVNEKNNRVVYHKLEDMEVDDEQGAKAGDKKSKDNC